MSFSDLGLSDELLRAVADAGYDTPTPIQEKAIPYVLMGRDILGCAQTGTGKTASFVLPMLDILHHGQAKARMPRSLILEPTRELAAQVADNFEIYGKYQRLSKALLIGGGSMNDQIKVIDSGVDVLIATPGRLLDLFERGRLLLNDVKLLVIDEADRMLDMGFIPDVEKIVSKLPKIRTTLMFSATMPKEIRRLADAFLMNPKEITVDAPKSATITQGLLMLPARAAAKEKRAALRDLIRRDDAKNGIIFCNRKRDVTVVCRSLERHGFDVGQLHGDMVQSMRMETLEKFKADKIRYLVCSDVAARGLDIPAMSHVFNFDVPTHAEDYIHRIGRTGRAGREGRAYTIALPIDAKYIGFIEKLIGKPIPLLKLDADNSKPVSAPPSSANNVEVEQKSQPHQRPRGGGRHAGRTENKPDAKPESTPENKTENSPTSSPDAQPDAQNVVVPVKREEQKSGGGRENRNDKESSNRDRNRNQNQNRDKNRDNNRDRGRNRGRGRDNDDDAMPDQGRVKGLGAHVPAFMMQAIKLPTVDDSDESNSTTMESDVPEKKTTARRTVAKKVEKTDETKPAVKKVAKPRKPRVTKKSTKETPPVDSAAPAAIDDAAPDEMTSSED